jgi:hypothetical protein
MHCAGRGPCTRQKGFKVELTQEQMEAAHFARQVDLDLTEDGPADPTGRELYEQGKAVLEQYTLSYSSRFVAGCARPRVPDHDGSILVDSGYIATSEARRIAYFRKRR